MLSAVKFGEEEWGYISFIILFLIFLFICLKLLHYKVIVLLLNGLDDCTSNKLNGRLKVPSNEFSFW